MSLTAVWISIVIIVLVLLFGMVTAYLKNQQKK